MEKPELENNRTAGGLSESKFPPLSDLHTTLNTAWPLGVGYLGAMLIGMTDTVMLGHLGTDALGAVGLALSICNIIIPIAWGMLFPIMVLASREYCAECPWSRIPFRIIRWCYRFVVTGRGSFLG
ncbi:MAG: MatE protein [Candidatus Kentron sp. G]|nr:MAG: MatE protein [Candidatus Kentron sp. G]VFM95799.1 MAG: MatE protein [Candidatus Kentron sp. G]VFM97632.1 MAG: MatE protein [Candidatus Kentron sp. G]